MEHKLFIDLIEDLGTEKIGKQSVRWWLVRCNLCQTEYKARAANIKNRNRCVCTDCAPKLHHKYPGGKQNHPLHATWELIKRRVDNTTNKKQGKDHYYNGINLCEEWKDFSNFVKWAEGNGYKPGLTIDREDVTKDYEPSNCRWVTQNVQNANKKVLSSNTTGYTGICLSGRPNAPYSCRITWEGKVTQKRFKTIKEAVEFRNKFITEHNLPHPIQEYKD